MAHRNRRPLRIGDGLFITGSSQTEEARPRPVHAGDPPRDLGQRPVAFAVMLKAVLQHDYGVCLATPFA